MPIVILLARKFLPKDIAYESNAVIEQIFEGEEIRWDSIFKAYILPILSIGAGCSLGRELPAADIGAGTAGKITNL